MHRITLTLLIAAALTAFTLAGAGCESSDKSEHPTTNADHPQGDHPDGEHPNGEHPDGEHPE